MYRLLVEADKMPAQRLVDNANRHTLAWEAGGHRTRQDPDLTAAKEEAVAIRDEFANARLAARNAWQLIWGPAIQPEQPQATVEELKARIQEANGVCCFCKKPDGGGSFMGADCLFEKEGSLYWECGQTPKCTFSTWTFEVSGSDIKTADKGYHF